MIELNNLKEELIEYGRLCGLKGYTPGVSGNISARYKDKILITTSGSANGYLSKDDFVLIGFDGKPINSDKKPSSEKMLHCEFYKQRNDVDYILHVHSPYLSAFASANIALDEPYMAENVFYFGKIPLAQYGLPSSKDLVEKTSKYFGEYKAVLMANHGFIIGDKSIRDAYLKLELAETYAQTVINAKILGGAIALNDFQVNEIYSLR